MCQEELWIQVVEDQSEDLNLSLFETEEYVALGDGAHSAPNPWTAGLPTLSIPA